MVSVLKWTCGYVLVVKPGKVYVFNSAMQFRELSLSVICCFHKR